MVGLGPPKRAMETAIWTTSAFKGHFVFLDGSNDWARLSHARPGYKVQEPPDPVAWRDVAARIVALLPLGTL